MNQVLFILQNWVSVEPIATLWVGVAAALFFGVTVAQHPGSFWGRGFFISLAKTLTLLTLMVGSYFVLSNGFTAFNKIYSSFLSNGSISNKAWRQWTQMYGGNYTQEDLHVSPYVSVEATEVVPPKNPLDPPLYRRIISEQPVTQNSISGFRGKVDLHVNGQKSNHDSFNVYSVDADYEYDIINNSGDETRVEFRFPLSSRSKLYQGISITVDGEEISWQIKDGAVYWERSMKPNQHFMVAIHFFTWGENTFLFSVSEPREITNFNLQVVLDKDYCCLATEPENGGIYVDAKSTPTENIITWHIDRAIMSPRFSVSTVQGWPYAPYQDLIVTLPFAARASILFLALTTLSLIIFKLDIRLSWLALLVGLFILPFLILMSGGIPHPANLSPGDFASYQTRMLPVIALLVLLPVYFILHRIPRAPLILILVLFLLSAGLFPLIGLYDQQKRNALEAFIQAGMIGYVFFLTLIVRVSHVGKERS
jgi:hypothetical protein